MERAPGALMINVRTFLIVCAFSLLQACGGGGGSSTEAPPTAPGSNNPNPDPPSSTGPGSFTITENTADFRILYHPGQAQAPKTIDLTVTNSSNVAGVGAAFPAAQGVPNWLLVSVVGTMPNFRVQITPMSHVQPGRYTATLLVGTGNANGAVLASREIAVTLEVVAPVSVGIRAAQRNLVFGSDEVVSFPLAVSATQGTWTISSDVPWIRVPAGTQSGSATIDSVLDGSSLAIGQHTGRITVQNAGYPLNSIVIPVTFNVQAPTVTLSRSSILLGGDDGTSFAAQALSATINTGTASYPWSLALSDADQSGWLRSNVSSGTVSANQEAAVQLRFDPGTAPPGTRSGTARFDVTVKGVVFNASVPVTLNFESHRLAPEVVGVALSSFPSRQRLTRSIRVRSSLGRNGIRWTASSNQPWLNVTSSGETGDLLILNASTPGVALNTSHIALVTLTSTEPSIQRSETVRVALWVSNTDPGDIMSAPLPRDMPYRVITNPVEPLAYSLSERTRIPVLNVYTGALVNTLQFESSRLLDDIGVSNDGRLLFVADRSTGETLVLDGNGLSSSPIAIYQGPNYGYRSYTLTAARPNGHSMVWTSFSEAWDTETHTRFELRRHGQFPGAFQGRPSITADGSIVVENNGGQPIEVATRTQRVSFIGGKALHMADGASLRLGLDTRGLGAELAITADQRHAFIRVVLGGNGSLNGDGGAKRLQFGPGQLSFLPDDLLVSTVKLPNSIRSTWDGRVFFGLSFNDNEVENNLLAFDADGNSLGGSMSGPNTHGRSSDTLAFSDDLFRVISTHIVPNPLNEPPVQFTISFYNLP